jgi:uncharacterized protein YjbI with pentapeptide repeats
MANTQHVEFALDQEKWAEFRKRQPDTRPDLRGANLEEAHLIGDFSGVLFDGAYMERATLPYRLTGATFAAARLHEARLGGTREARDEFDRRNTVFRDAQMSDCCMRYANFSGADFSGADLRGAMFEGALLTGANFTDANLADAHFDGSGLGRAVFSGARLQKTYFAEAELEWTMFDAVDLSGATGLEFVKHHAPSAVTLATVYRSGGRVPEAFLLGTQQDAPEDVLVKLRDTFRTLPFEYWSCFVSYASEDSEFVDYLTRRLKRAGVSFWRDRASLRTGEAFERRIGQAIARYDRFLVVLSSQALQSEWVRKEIHLALARKRYDLLPIRLDDSVLAEANELYFELRSDRHVANFSRWRESQAFSEQFNLLLSALRRA